MPKLICLLFIFYSNISCCESLSGTWAGYFSDDIAKENPIRVVIISQGDTSYDISSYTIVKDANGNSVEVVCAMAGQAVTSRSLILQETSFIKPKNFFAGCLQTFFLKLHENDKESIMQGKWRSACTGTVSGTVVLKRKKIESKD